MGTGKTTVAIQLANKLGMRYVSTDNLIEAREKRTINEIFQKSGEDYFRDVESEVVREVSGSDGLVIDTGGGVVIRGENLDSLNSTGIVICLTADEDTIIERTKKYKHRPLLNVEDPKLKVRSLMAKRAPFYAKCKYSVDTGKYTIRQVIDQIVKLVEGDK
jgi:shikimate kinase